MLNEKSEKIDKFTTYYDAFKAETEKIQTKIDNDDELTYGQKALMWENF